MYWTIAGFHEPTGFILSSLFIMVSFMEGVCRKLGWRRARQKDSIDARLKKKKKAVFKAKSYLMYLDVIIAKKKVAAAKAAKEALNAAAAAEAAEKAVKKEPNYEDLRSATAAAFLFASEKATVEKAKVADLDETAAGRPAAVAELKKKRVIVDQEIHRLNKW
jgi:hypothetical protein